ncbi:MAG: hypothetical protein ACFFBP_01805 [Promethearchaeota archaeon]
MSEAEIPINMEFLGIGSIKAVIYRHISPLSADAILDKIPCVLRGRFSFGSKKYWTLMNVGIRKGPNLKAIKNFERGEIVYDPKSDELILILENLEMSNKMNKIGKITSNIELFEKARNGLNCKITK